MAASPSMTTTGAVPAARHSALPNWIGRTALALRTLVLVSLVLVSAAIVAGSAYFWWRAERQNAVVRALAAGQDVAIDAATAGDIEIVARVRYLDTYDRVEEAQSLLDLAGPRLGREAAATAYFNHANAVVRRALERIERGDLDSAIPLVAMAKGEYRKALRLAPEGWDIRHNFDVAMRLVRDFPGHEQDGEEAEDGAKRLWTDLPGVPKGLP